MKVLLLSFHFAGGNKYSFNKIFEGFNNISTELQRHNDYPKLDKVVNNSIFTLTKYICNNTPYILYGHSMGALLAYLVCQELQEQSLPIPQKLILSGKKAPRIPREKKISHLSDNEFWNEILALGGVPEEMKNYPEIIEYYLPILRHDFRLVESYRYEKKPKLNIPIDVFYGSEEATKEEMIGWEDETTEKVTITQLLGNHFFIFNHVEYFRTYFDNLVNQK